MIISPMKKLGIKKNIENRMYKSFDKLFTEQKKIKLYEKYNQNLLGFISLLDNELRLIYQIKILEDRNYKNIDIMNKLNIKSEYRVKKIKELTRLYNYIDLNKLFIKIKEIDYKSKTTDIDIESLIEDFIINLDK